VSSAPTTPSWSGPSPKAAGIEPAFIPPSQCASPRLHSQQRTRRSRSAPLPLGADEVLLGHAALFEEEVRADGGAQASGAQAGPGAQARAVSLDDERGEPLNPWAWASAEYREAEQLALAVLGARDALTLAEAHRAAACTFTARGKTRVLVLPDQICDGPRGGARAPMWRRQSGQWPMRRSSRC
jgi:hypothetical protein